MSFISQSRSLLEGMEQSLNDLTTLPQILNSLLGKVTSSFKLYSQMRKLYTKPAGESVKKQFHKICSEFINIQINALDISQKLTIGEREFLVDVQPDPFAICFEGWFQNHVEIMLNFILHFMVKMILMINIMIQLIFIQILLKLII